MISHNNLDLIKNFGSKIKSYCDKQHELQFLKVELNKKTKCCICLSKDLQLEKSMECKICNYNICEICLNTKRFQKTKEFYLSLTSKTKHFPEGVPIKLSDRYHKTFIYLPYFLQSGEHPVFTFTKKMHSYQKFDTMSSIVLIPSLIPGYFQILSMEHQALLYVANDRDFGGDHGLWACPIKTWNNYDNYMKRTAFSFESAEDGGWRIRDYNHNTYLFVGNYGNEGGDHILYAIDKEKYNKHPVIWNERSIFEIQGGEQQSLPLNRIVKLFDTVFSTFLYQCPYNDSDSVALSLNQSELNNSENYAKTNFVLVAGKESGLYMIMNHKEKSYLYVGYGPEDFGDHLVWSATREAWSNDKEFFKRSQFKLIPVNGNCWRIYDTYRDTYLFVNENFHSIDYDVFEEPENKYILFGVPIKKFESNPDEWTKRTLFYIY